MPKSKAVPSERFWAKVEKSPGCWIWTAAKDRDGYGQFKLDGRMRPAHRVSYEFASGLIPAGMEIDHECLNASCVNPDHLRLATRKQNSEHTADYLGLFINLAEAEAAAIAKRNELYTHNALDRGVR